MVGGRPPLNHPHPSTSPPPNNPGNAPLPCGQHWICDVGERHASKSGGLMYEDIASPTRGSKNRCRSGGTCVYHIAICNARLLQVESSSCSLIGRNFLESPEDFCGPFLTQ